MSAAEFFAQIRQIPAPWRDGSLPLPTFYHDATAIQASYLASSDAVRAWLPSTRMHPLRVVPGRCAVVLMALSYRETDLGPYNEVLVGIPFTLDESSPQFTGLLRQPSGAPLIYVHRLPVTTETARDPGIHFLAAPKFVADITFDESKHWVRCEASENGHRMLTLDVRKGPVVPCPRTRVCPVTVERGFLLRWEFIESEQRKRVSHRRSDARLALGSHRVAQELREMRLGRLLSCEHKPQFRAVLGPVIESFRAS